MKTRFLITTPLRNTWKQDVPVLFLGEWCKRFSEKGDWEKLDYKTLSYHWDDREKLQEDYNYLDSIYETTLKYLTSHLNTYHNTNFDLQYWRIIIGPWLIQFIQICFDRWQNINKAFKENIITETMVIDFDGENLVPDTMYDFMTMCVEDDWNHFLYSTILLYLKPEIIFTYVSPKNSRNINAKSTIRRSTQLKTLKNKIRYYLTAITDICSKKSNYFFIDTFLTAGQQTKIDLALGDFPSFFRTRYCFNKEDAKLDNHVRTGFKIETKLGEFESFLYKIIPKQIPLAYLEGFSKLQQQVLKSSWTSSPKVVMTCTAHIHDDFFKVWVANQQQQGTKLVIAQHSGSYGVNKIFTYEDHELKVCDTYFSWGRSDFRNNMIPNVGGRIINSTLQLKNNYNGGILFLLQSFPRYSYHLYSSPISSQFLEYRESQSSFISKLKDSIKSELYIRMPPADFGNDSKLFWSDRFPNVRYDTNSSFYTSMKSHRIIVSSSHSSVVSESLAANIPTVVLWDPACFELSEIAIPIYGLLLDAKIVHRTSLEAAAFINDIWDDIPSWWSTPSVQQARSEFCNEFASSTDNWAGQWKKNLSSVSV